MLQPHLALCLADPLLICLATLTTRLMLMMITTIMCDADSGCYGYPEREREREIPYKSAEKHITLVNVKQTVKHPPYFSQYIHSLV